MNNPKSEIISFRLPHELAGQVKKMAEASRCKNAHAWCQKLVVDALSEKSNVHFEDVNSCKQSQINAASDLAAAIAERQQQQLNHIRKNQIKFFETLFVGTEQETAFHNQVLESEAKWEEISATATSVCPTDKFTEFGSFVEEMSNVAEKMIDPFSGEELIMQKAEGEKNHFVPNEDTQHSKDTSGAINQPAEATANLAEINRVDNSPVQ